MVPRKFPKPLIPTALTKLIEEKDEKAIASRINFLAEAIKNYADEKRKLLVMGTNDHRLEALANPNFIDKVKEAEKKSNYDDLFRVPTTSRVKKVLGKRLASQTDDLSKEVGKKGAPFITAIAADILSDAGKNFAMTLMSGVAPEQKEKNDSSVDNELLSNLDKLQEYTDNLKLMAYAMAGNLRFYGALASGGHSRDIIKENISEFVQSNTPTIELVRISESTPNAEEISVGSGVHAGMHCDRGYFFAVSEMVKLMAACVEIRLEKRAQNQISLSLDDKQNAVDISLPIAESKRSKAAPTADITLPPVDSPKEDEQKDAVRQSSEEVRPFVNRPIISPKEDKKGSEVITPDAFTPPVDKTTSPKEEHVAVVLTPDILPPVDSAAISSKSQQQRSEVSQVGVDTPLPNNKTAAVPKPEEKLVASTVVDAGPPKTEQKRAAAKQPNVASTHDKKDVAASFKAKQKTKATRPALDSATEKRGKKKVAEVKAKSSSVTILKATQRTAILGKRTLEALVPVIQRRRVIQTPFRPTSTAAADRYKPMGTNIGFGEEAKASLKKAQKKRGVRP